MVFWLVVDPLALSGTVFLGPPILLSMIGFVYPSNFFFYRTQVGRFMIYYGSPLVYSLLDVVDLLYYLNEYYSSFWATPTINSV